MRQRGRQSAADLEVNGETSARANLQPPHHLTAKEAQLFREVVANAPSGQFSASDVYLLSTFVRVTLICDDAAKALSKATDKNRPTRMKIMDQAVKAQALLASKLRLAPQSRIGPRTAGRAHDGHRPSAYDSFVMGADDGWPSA